MVASSEVPNYAPLAIIDPRSIPVNNRCCKTDVNIQHKGSDRGIFIDLQIDLEIHIAIIETRNPHSNDCTNPLGFK
jgi:hypothetical protein